jgi:DNA-3-methyladenine glycosylase II
MKSFSFGLRPVPPFRLDLTAWALRRRARNLVDQWDSASYRRVLVLDGVPLEVVVRQLGSSERPRLEVTVNGSHSRQELRGQVAGLLVQILGLRANLTPFYAMAQHDRRLAPLVSRFRGVKPPRFPTVFEALVNAIACQQLSLTVGIELLNRVALQCGQTVEHASSIQAASSIQPAFPRPEDLIELKAQRLRSLGFSYSKARSMLALSGDILADRFDAGRLKDMPNANAVDSLTELRGVGRWTAEYVLLRGLGRIDVFPGDDVGARNRLAAWLGRDSPLDYDAVKQAVKRWHPYAGLVYFHMLLAGLADAGQLIEDSVSRMSA